MSSAQLRLRLFGSPSVTGADGARITGGIDVPHRLALLALLALHPKRAVSRAGLSRLLWPTLNSEQASQALNQALFAISKALGDDAIFPSAKEVRLGARVSVDALEFKSALESGRPEDALQLYTAPLLDGFDLDDAPEFRHWAATQRSRFANLAKTLRPETAAASEVLHDLAEPDGSDDVAKPERPEPTPKVAPREPPERRVPEARKPIQDLELLAEPVIQAPAEASSDALDLQSTVPQEPELLRNAVPVEHETVVPAATEPGLMTNAVTDEPPAVTTAHAPPPVESTPAESTPVESTPAESAPAEIAPAESAPVESVPVESVPAEQPAKRRRRELRLPSRRVVATVLVVIALGALGYMARRWAGIAKEGVAAVRGRAEEGVAAVRGRAEAARLARDRERSIAVLPIEYTGRNQADAALAARIVEQLGPMLTRGGLLVKPGTALTRGGTPNDLRVIADSLKVDHILQGVMQREGAGVAFRFRLVNPVDGTARWDETYRPQLADIQVLEEDVAASVVKQILQR